MQDIILNTLSYCKKQYAKLEKQFYPATCLSCNKTINSFYNLCTDCWDNIEILYENNCDICGSSLEFAKSSKTICTKCHGHNYHFDKVISFCSYNSIARKLIQQFKFHDKTNLTKFFAIHMLFASKEILSKIDYITFVPIHRNRLFIRKYNQSALLSKKLAILLNNEIPILYRLMFRVINTKPQYQTKNTQDRIQNIQNAFKINDKIKDKIVNKSILLIDDIITSGSTVNEISKLLKKNKVSKIYVLTIARTEL